MLNQPNSTSPAAGRHWIVLGRSCLRVSEAQTPHCTIFTACTIFRRQNVPSGTAPTACNSSCESGSSSRRELLDLAATGGNTTPEGKHAHTLTLLNKQALQRYHVGGVRREIFGSRQYFTLTPLLSVKKIALVDNYRGNMAYGYFGKDVTSSPYPRLWHMRGKGHRSMSD